MRRVVDNLQSCMCIGCNCSCARMSHCCTH